MKDSENESKRWSDLDRTCGFLIKKIRVYVINGVWERAGRVSAMGENERVRVPAPPASFLFFNLNTSL